MGPAGLHTFRSRHHEANLPMATDPGLILPKPGIPKTLGILNIIFGVLAVLGTGCTLGVTVATPTLLQFSERTVKEAQSNQEKKKVESLKSLEEREKTETTEAQKAAIAQERDAINSQSKIPTVDYSTIQAMTTNPLVMGYNIAYLGTGLVLSLLLLISGITLVRLSRVGRPLANAWGVLQIAHIALFTAISIFYVQPATKPIVEKVVADLEAQAKAGNAPPQVVQQLQMARAMQQSSATIMLAVLFALVLAIYPVILLILLNTAGAKAAFPAGKPGLEPEF